MKIILSFVLLAFVLNANSASAQRAFIGKPQYQIEVHRADTVMGRIVVELFPAIAPLTVTNFDSLVEIHFYDSTAFHRVVPGFVIQGGDPNSRSGDTSTWGYGDPEQTTILPEFTAISHRRGILSMARTPDIYSATSQFFICVAADTNLDHHYAAFGRVVSRMDVVDSIVKVPSVKPANRPIEKISMFITKIGSNDSAAIAPALLAPSLDTTISQTRPVLRWHRSRSTMIYHLQLADGADFSNILLDTNRSQVDSFFTSPRLQAGKTYYWRVQANNGGSISDYSPVWSFTVATSGVADKNVLSLRLDQSSPNPMTEGGVISYQLPGEMPTRLVVRDLLGNEWLVFAHSIESAGEHSVRIDPAALTPGYYNYSVETPIGILSRSMIVR